MTDAVAIAKEVKAANKVEVTGQNLLVNVTGRERLKTFLPTMKIPLSHVRGAEADPGIEQKLWLAWALGRSKDCVAEPGVKFYNPHRGMGDKAIVIHLKDEICDRLVVEVQDPAADVEKINRVAGAS